MSFAHQRPSGHKILSPAGSKSASRFKLQPHDPNHVPAQRFSPAIAEGRTIYSSTVKEPGANVLKPGGYQAKLGNRVLKGEWKGFPIFSLTLEERKTCPTDCAVWSRCYGNNMHLAKRYAHGPALEAAIEREVAALARKYSVGFVVRLHILGDFYSLGYVALWRRLLARHEALRVFGYTARHADPIGRALSRLRDSRWDSFAVRQSGSATARGSITISRVEDKPAGAIICPAQLGQTEGCGTCALCWSAPDKTIAFLEH